MDGDERGRRELSFYETVFHSDIDDHSLLRRFVSQDLFFSVVIRYLIQVPRFLGRRVVLNREFIVLEDVSCGGRNVMDVKIGAITWDHLASEEKIAAEKSKFAFGLELGFRLLGYRVSDPSTL